MISKVSLVHSFFLTVSLNASAEEIDCNSYLEKSERSCASISGGRAHLYQTMDKTILLHTLSRMISGAEQIKSIEIQSLEQFLDASRMGKPISSMKESEIIAGAPTTASVEYGYSQALNHALAICQRFHMKEEEKELEKENGSPYLFPRMSLLSDPQLKTWMDGDRGKKGILEKLQPPDQCAIQLTKNKTFREDLNIAVTEQKNKMLQKISKYEKIKEKIHAASGDAFKVLSSDRDVFLDMFLFAEPTNDLQGGRRRCKYLQVADSINRSEGFKDAARESALNVASLAVGPEVLVLGTLGKAGVTLEKLENLMVNLRIFKPDAILSPRNLKTLSEDKRLLKDLNVDPSLLHDLPEVLMSKFHMGYAEFLERMGLSSALHRGAGYTANKVGSTSVRNELVREVQALAKKGVSINPNRASRVRARERLKNADSVDSTEAAEYTVEELVSKGVYADEPGIILRRINQEFPGGYREFLRYLRRSNN